jgi:cystathionine beta-lyase
MHRLIVQVAGRQGITVKFVPTADLSKLEAAITEGKTKLIHLESPSNPCMRITDLRAVAKLAHAKGAMVSVDCTMMTPVRCQPLLLGCDIVVHSATKFFSGHSDVMGGFVCVRSPALAKRVAFNQNACGTALAPFDSWLMLRGLKTLALRVDRQESNALVVASFLGRQRRFVTRLHYAGINPDDPTVAGLTSLTKEGFDVHRRQCTGPGTVLSFETGDVEASKRFVDACQLFKLTVSFGSTNSLVEMPCALSHASIPKEQRTLPEDLVRLSVGIEHPQDLLRDIANAIRVAQQPPTAST